MSGQTFKSSIYSLKAKFFIYRALTYFSFLLLPIWLQKSQSLHPVMQGPVMILYITFMICQWYLLGKEIDHRFKIYFKVNSSLDRAVYRLLVGMISFIFYFNLLSLLPSKWTYNCFWVTWAILGTFYSWPTRGKIIRESVTVHFKDWFYLDSFEKTLLILIGIFFFITVPDLPSFASYDALKLYLDPGMRTNFQWWNFLTVNYYPFFSYDRLFKMGLFMHYYFVNVGIFLLMLYVLLRFFVHRRLAILGVFAFISSWSLIKLLATSAGMALTLPGIFSLLWIWSLIWSIRSATYRSGFMLGLVSYWGTLIYRDYAILTVIQFALIFYFMRKTNGWYKKKLLKYSLVGISLTLITIFLTQGPLLDNFNFKANTRSMIDTFCLLLDRKAFYAISLIGLVLWVLKIKYPYHKKLAQIYFDRQKQIQLSVAWPILILFAYFFDRSLIQAFALMWPLILLSVVVLEVLFQKIHRMRSQRNMIYLIYIIICLLDSHIEGRVKIWLNFFNL